MDDISVWRDINAFQWTFISFDLMQTCRCPNNVSEKKHTSWRHKNKNTTDGVTCVELPKQNGASTLPSRSKENYHESPGICRKWHISREARCKRSAKQMAAWMAEKDTETCDSLGDHEGNCLIEHESVGVMSPNFTFCKTSFLINHI